MTMVTMIGFYLGNTQVATTMVAFITMIGRGQVAIAIMEIRTNEKVTIIVGKLSLP